MRGIPTFSSIILELIPDAIVEEQLARTVCGPYCSKQESSKAEEKGYQNSTSERCKAPKLASQPWQPSPALTMSPHFLFPRRPSMTRHHRRRRPICRRSKGPWDQIAHTPKGRVKSCFSCGETALFRWKKIREEQVPYGPKGHQLGTLHGRSA